MGLYRSPQNRPRLWYWHCSSRRSKERRSTKLTNVTFLLWRLLQLQSILFLRGLLICAKYNHLVVTLPSILTLPSPCHDPLTTLSSPCHLLVRDEGGLNEGEDAQLLASGRKEDDGDGEKAGGETASKRAKDIDGNKQKVRTSSYCWYNTRYIRNFVQDRPANKK